MAVAGERADDNVVTGLLLCRAAQQHLAFLADHVTTIEAYRGGNTPHAAEAFDEDVLSGKLLRAPNGEAVGVDEVQVFSDDAVLLPAPRIMLAGIGGALCGFVSVNEILYPVLRLAEFSRFLSSARKSQQSAGEAAGAIAP